MNNIISVIITLILPIVTISYETFPIIWNGPSYRCDTKYNVSLPFWKYGIETNKKQLFYGDKIVLFYDKQLGLYPFVDKNGKIINGGIPQRANLGKHLRILARDIRKAIPDVSFSGLAVIDWEGWRPVWKANWADRRIYNKLSIEYSKKIHHKHRHHHYHKRKIRRKAQREFNKSAKLFLLATLSIAKQVRPRAKWGFYGYPICDYDAFYGVCSSKTHKMNRKWKWLFDASNAIYPSIYLKKSHLKQPQKDRHLYIQAILLEAQSAARKNKNPIYPYTTLAYNLYVTKLDFYSKTDLCSSLKQSADLGMDGIVLWLSYTSVSTKQGCGQIYNYTEDLLGPYSLIVRDQANRCSEKWCDNRGTCHKEPQNYCNTITPFEQYQCKCKRAYRGRHCNKPAIHKYYGWF